MSADEIRSTVPLAASPQQTPAPDAGLWERCMDGDRQAFQQLMLSHLDELFAAAQRDLRYHVLLGTCASTISARRNWWERPCCERGAIGCGNRHRSGFGPGCLAYSFVC
jgi:hypothetical protein